MPREGERRAAVDKARRHVWVDGCPVEQVDLTITVEGAPGGAQRWRSICIETGDTAAIHAAARVLLAALRREAGRGSGGGDGDRGGDGDGDGDGDGGPSLGSLGEQFAAMLGPAAVVGGYPAWVMEVGRRADQQGEAGEEGEAKEDGGGSGEGGGGGRIGGGGGDGDGGGRIGGDGDGSGGGGGSGSGSGGGGGGGGGRASGWTDIPDNLEERAAALDAMLDGGAYPARHEILPGQLYLGTQGAAGVGDPDGDPMLVLEGLRKDGITAIVNCTGEARAYGEGSETAAPILYSCANLPHKPATNGGDGWADFTVAVREMVGFIEGVIGAGGGGVLVHCNNGQNRSAAIVTACVMKVRRLGLREAYLYVRGIRGIVQTKLGPLLAAYEEELVAAGVLRGTGGGGVGGGQGGTLYTTCSP